MKNFVYFLLFLAFHSVSGQTKYPQKAFRNPLEFPMVLAGTFGELRTNHFHSGIDIKTKGVSGHKVHTAKEGYVSRIKVSLWGYGKALYVTHPNGYTTVYGHLKKFSDKIEKLVKQRQYQKKSFEVQLFLGPNKLPIATNEIIAYAGNTGGSSGPHLHFEIRDTKTEKIINPLLFGYKVKDNIAPTLKSVRITPLNKKSAVNQIPVAQNISIQKTGPHTYTTKTISAIGKIGFAVNTHDLLNYAHNKNGVYSIQMHVNDSLAYHHQLETFSFNESKYINLLIDYPYYAKKRQKFQKTYIEKVNKLSIYQQHKQKGWVTVAASDILHVKITIKDIAKNTTTVHIPVKGDTTILTVATEDKTSPYWIDSSKYTVFSKGKSEVRFPRGTFYKNTYIDYQYNSKYIRVHKPILPLHKKYTLSYYIDSLPTHQKKHIYFALKKGRYYNYVNTIHKDNKIYTNTKYLGDFYLKFDSIAPKIYKPSFYKNQNISKQKTLSIRIKDNETGIKSYYAKIDNKWILMEYQPKRNRLFYDLKDLKPSNTTHKFQLKVADQLGNTQTYTSQFIK